MNKEILKRNIEQVIMQPCLSKYPTEIKQNGLSEDGKYIMVKVRPDDSSMKCNLEWNGEKIDYVQEIVDKLPEKYRSHLVTLRHDPNWISYAYIPVFDTETQEKWDKAFEDFCKAKQEWCDKYGCD